MKLRKLNSKSIEMEAGWYTAELQPMTIVENIYQKQNLLRDTISTLIQVVDNPRTSWKLSGIAEKKIEACIKSLITE